MRQLLLTAIVAAPMLYLLVAAVLFTFQRKLLFVPDTSHPEAAQAGVPGLQPVTIEAPGGAPLLAWYVPPPQGRPTLLYFHGNGGSIGNRRGRLRQFAGNGWGVLMPEYPGYGGNPGTPSEAAFARAAAGAMSYLVRHATAPDRIAVYGESIGTGVATRIAAENQVGALVLESPFTSMTDIARRRFPYLPVAWMLRDRFDQLSRIGDVRCPILVLQGARDGIVPPDLGRALFDAAPQPKQFWSAAQGGHSNLMDLGAMEIVVDFLDRVLGAPPTR